MFYLHIQFIKYFSQPKKENRPPLRQYLMDGDFFIGTTLAGTLTKLVLKYIEWENNDVNYMTNVERTV